MRRVGRMVDLRPDWIALMGFRVIRLIWGQGWAGGRRMRMKKEVERLRLMLMREEFVLET